MKSLGVDIVPIVVFILFAMISIFTKDKNAKSQKPAQSV
jgi:hypothetical protein